MDRSDRATVNALHNVSSGSGSSSARQPTSLRDASGSNSRSRPGAWGTGGPANVIHPPVRRSAADRSNPYSLGIMKDTLTPSRQYGNPTATQTIVKPRKPLQPRWDDPPRKRAKMDSLHDQVIPNTVSGNTRGNRHLQRVTRKPPSSHPPEVINVDDDEDIGVPLPRFSAAQPDLPTSSPDPLRLSESSHSPIPPGGLQPLRPHAFETTEPFLPPSKIIEESETTRYLRQRHDERDSKAMETKEVHHVSDSEPERDEIQNDSDVEALPDPPRKRKASPTLNAKNVRSKIQLYDQKEKDKDKAKVPHIDLRNGTYMHKSSVANGMKPKGGNVLSGLKFSKTNHGVQPSNKPSNNFVDDPFSAPSLDPGPSKLAASKAPSSGVKDPRMLPLEAWALGPKIYRPKDGERHLLYWDTQTKKIMVRSSMKGKSPQHQLLEFVLNNNINTIKVTNANPALQGFPVIQIKLGKLYKPGSWPSADFAHYINPGSRGLDSLVTLKFLRDDHEDQRQHDQWRDTEYQQLVSFLRSVLNKDQIETLDHNATAGVWELIENADGLRKEKASRTSSTANSVPPQTANGGRARPKPRPITQSTKADSGSPSESLRHSVRQNPSRKFPSTDPDELILVYPPSGNGAINITQGDLNRLEDGEYLNDTLIEFGLKLWLDEIRADDPELASQIHVFSSFFYKKLKNGKNVEEGYQSVRKWTQKFDLFQKKYLIVPINEHLHWYLAIIYQPEHVLRAAPPLPTPTPSVSTRARKIESEKELKQVLSSSKTDHSLPQGHDVLAVSQSASSVDFLLDDSNADVEDIFQNSCSISSAHSKPTSTASSSAIDQKALTAEATEPMAVDEVRSSPELQYPSADAQTSEMEVDQLQNELEADEMVLDMPSLSSISTPNSPADSKKKNPSAPNGAPVIATNFYASAKAKGKGKENTGPRPFPLDVLDVAHSDDGEQDEVDEILAEPEASEQPEQHTTFVFTLDSLGSKHPQAIKYLKEYLKLEAKDKKQIIDSSDAKGYQAYVPLQPNYCDCGLYLLHLAKTFVKRPVHHCQTILSRKKSSIAERHSEWNNPAVESSRKELKDQIGLLSKEWKQERAMRLKEKGDESAKPESSDDEVDIVEDTTGTGTSATKSATGRAKRMRG